MRWYISILVISVLITSCDSNPNNSDPVDCSEYKQRIFNKETAFAASGYDKDHLQDLIFSYADFSNNCRQDSITAEFLMRRADLLRGEGKIRESIRQFKAVHDGFPTFHNKIACAFIAAFLYENELNDRETAEKLYLQIIESYPKSNEADIARVSLRHLYETSDEMITRLKSNE